MSAARSLGLLPTHYIPGPAAGSALAKLLRMRELRRDPIPVVAALHEKYGELVLLAGERRRTIVASGLEYGKIVQANSVPFVLRGPPNSAQRRLSSSLAALSGMRPLLDERLQFPAAQQTYVGSSHDKYVALIEKFLSRWQPGETRNLLDEMRALARAIAGKMVYGSETMDKSLLQAIEDWRSLNYSISAKWFQANWPLTSYRRLLALAEQIEAKHLAALDAKLGETAGMDDTFRSLLCASEKEGEPLARAIILFVAISETTAHILTWALFLLARHPTIQAELLDELDAFRTGTPRPQQLKHAPLLDNVLKETIRIFPVCALDRRIMTADTELGPYFVPRGSLIWVNQYAIHHSPELFEEPERFRPARWKKGGHFELTSLPLAPLAMPGIGSASVDSLVKAALTMIQSRWRLTVKSHAWVDRQAALTLSPKRGIPVVLSRQDRQFETYPIHGDIHEMVHFPEMTTVAVSSLPRAA